MSSTSPPELESIKIAWVSGNLTVLCMRLQEAQEHFPLEQKMQSYGNIPCIPREAIINVDYKPFVQKNGVKDALKALRSGF